MRSVAERAALLSHEELLQEYISTVTALFQEKNELSEKTEELSKQYTELSEEVKKLSAKNEELSEKNAALKVQNDWLARQLFGKKSERLYPRESSPNQLTLGEGYEPEETPPPPTTTVKSYERSHRKDEVVFSEEESRLKFDETVPVEVVNVPNPATEGLSEEDYEV